MASLSLCLLREAVSLVSLLSRLLRSLTWNLRLGHAVDPTQDYSLFAGFIHLGAGLACGFTGLAAGYAIGIVGDAVRFSS